MMKEEKPYICMGCFEIVSKEEREKGECANCGKNNFMKTYNASNSTTITSRDLY
ncbi:MAG: hypothetical protein ACOCQR_01725 [bacterium]